MRRSDREIKDFEDILQVMEKCDVCRLALYNEPYPYILPLNFGMEVIDGQVILYFHGANEGTKYNLMAKNNHVCFEMDCEHVLAALKDGCTMSYKSVIGTGTISFIENEDEKVRALDLIMTHYHQETMSYNKKVVPHTTVFKITVDNLTGKSRRMPKAD